MVVVWQAFVELTHTASLYKFSLYMETRKTSLVKTRQRRQNCMVCNFKNSWVTFAGERKAHIVTTSSEQTQFHDPKNYVDNIEVI